MPVKRLDKVFAFNVNLFWVRDCEDEVALLHERISPGGAIFLFYEATEITEVPRIVEGASAALVKAGFRVSVVEQQEARGDRPYRPTLKTYCLMLACIRNIPTLGSQQT